MHIQLSWFKSSASAIYHCRVNGSFVRYLYPSTSQSTVEKNAIEVLMNASLYLFPSFEVN